VELCERLAGAGFQVIRFDHRDVGRSTKIDAPVPASVPALVAALGAGRLAPPYALDDLAAEAWGLLDALGIRAAHLCGISQGGGVAQLMAAQAQDRTRSLVSIAATSANPGLPGPDPGTMALLLDTPRCADVASFVAWQLLVYTKTGSPTRPPDHAWIRRRAERVWEHGYDHDGFLRHLVAVVTAPDRRPALRGLRVPTLVIHGDADPIIPIAAGRDVASCVPDARFVGVPGMGHDLAPEFWEEVVGEIAGQRRAARRPAPIGWTRRP
jgi:pimeloyl-ACP methyl ester carboxylesterase